MSTLAYNTSKAAGRQLTTRTLGRRWGQVHNNQTSNALAPGEMFPSKEDQGGRSTRIGAENLVRPRVRSCRIRRRTTIPQGRGTLSLFASHPAASTITGQVLADRTAAFSAFIAHMRVPPAPFGRWAPRGARPAGLAVGGARRPGRRALGMKVSGPQSPFRRRCSVRADSVLDPGASRDRAVPLARRDSPKLSWGGRPTAA
jgi:hypothetical protein